MVSSLKKRTFRYFDLTPTSVIMSHVTKDIGILDNSLTQFFMFFMTNLVQFVGFFVIVSISIPYMIIIFIPALLVIGKLTSIYVKAGIKLRTLTVASTSPFLNSFFELFHGVGVIRNMGKSRYFQEKFYKNLDTHNNALQHELFARQWINTYVELIMTLVVFCVGLSCVFVSYYK